MAEEGSGPPQPPGRRPGSDQQVDDATGDGSGSVPDPPQPGPVKPQPIPAPAKAAVLRSPTIRLEPATVSVAPGAGAVAVLSITNRSDPIARFDIELEDASIGWITPDPASVNLWKDEAGTIQLTIAPPRGAHIRAGRLVVGVRITSSRIPEGSVSVALAIEVTAVEAIDAVMSPLATSGIREGRHRVEVRNEGGAPWHARATATDPQEALVINMTPPSLMVPPYGSEMMHVSVRPAKWLLLGGPKQHRFTLALAPPTGPAKTLDGSFEQRPYIPRWTVAPTILVAVLALAVIGGVLPPRPVASPTPAGSNTSADGGSGNPEPSVSPSAGASESASPSAATPSDSPPPATAPSNESPPPASAPPSVPPPNPSLAVATWASGEAAKLAATNYDVGPASGGTLDFEDGWSVQAFENATIYRTDEQQIRVIRDPILDRWRLLGKVTPDTDLGYPTFPQVNVPVGFEFQRFANGAIQCNADKGNCFVVHGKVYAAWQKYRKQLGYPTVDVVRVRVFELQGTFEDGTIHVDMAGAVTVCGPDGTLEGGGPIGCGGSPPVVAP